MNIESLFQKCLDCLSLLQGVMSLAGQTKAQHGPEGEGQEKGETAMLIIQVRLLGSALCLTAEGVLSYTVLSHTQRRKDKVKSKKQ